MVSSISIGYPGARDNAGDVPQETVLFPGSESTSLQFHSKMSEPCYQRNGGAELNVQECSENLLELSFMHMPDKVVDYAKKHLRTWM